MYNKSIGSSVRIKTIMAVIIKTEQTDAIIQHYQTQEKVDQSSKTACPVFMGTITLLS